MLKYNLSQIDTISKKISSYLSKTDFLHLPTSAWAQLIFSQTKWKNISNGKLKLGMPKEILR